MIRNDDLYSTLEKFKEIIESPSNFDNEEAGVLLHELKIILMKHEYLSNDANNKDFAERMMFREVLELSMIMCVKTENFKDIQNYFNQLTFYYFENDDLPQSERMFTMIDISLLASLAFENNEEYFINLAQIRTTFPDLNFILQFVLDVELCLNSNSISKLSRLMENSPSCLFDIFLDKILFRIRKTLAKNAIKQSISITTSHLATLLQFSCERDLNEFLNSLDWQINEDGEIIEKTEEVRTEKQNQYDRLENILSYAIRFNSLL